MSESRGHHIEKQAVRNKQAGISAQALVARPAYLKWCKDNGAFVDPCILQDPVALTNWYKRFLQQKGKRERQAFQRQHDVDSENGHPSERMLTPASSSADGDMPSSSPYHVTHKSRKQVKSDHGRARYSSPGANDHGNQQPKSRSQPQPFWDDMMQPTAYIWGASDRHSFLHTVIRRSPTVTKEDAENSFWQQWELEHAAAIAAMAVPATIIGRLKKWVNHVFVPTVLSTIDGGIGNLIPSPSEARDPALPGCSKY
jgi:hypothetical protein